MIITKTLTPRMMRHSPTRPRPRRPSPQPSPCAARSRSTREPVGCVHASASTLHAPRRRLKAHSDAHPPTGRAESTQSQLCTHLLGRHHAPARLLLPLPVHELPRREARERRRPHRHPALVSASPRRAASHPRPHPRQRRARASVSLPLSRCPFPGSSSSSSSSSGGDGDGDGDGDANETHVKLREAPRVPSKPRMESMRPGMVSVAAG